MQGIIDADTHISEGEAMWAMLDESMRPRRPLMLSVPEDTVFANRNAFWLIDGEIYPKAGALDKVLRLSFLPFALIARVQARQSFTPAK